MNARMVAVILALVVVLLGGVATWLFWVQNSARRVMLSLNLGLFKLELAEAVPVPVLMSLCILGGLALGLLLTGIPWMRASGRARRAERSAALSSSREGGEGAW